MNAQPTRLSVSRDLVSYLGGWALMLKQAGIIFPPPPNPNETLIWVAALLIGVPGVLQVIAWRFGTGGVSTSLPAGGSPPPLESSSPTTGGEA